MRRELYSIIPTDIRSRRYREGRIDTGTAEAFSAVSEERQLEVWKEVGGQPHHAEQVRNIIAHGRIDASNALFDVNRLPEEAVSRDLFSERVLVERTAFYHPEQEQRKRVSWLRLWPRSSPPRQTAKWTIKPSHNA